MRAVTRTAIVPYTPQQMFDLVADVERYPEFLPWCTDAQLLARNERELTGRIAISQGPLNVSFTTRNELDEPRWMSMDQVEGPFSELHGEWSFGAIGDEGSRVTLDIRFGFSSSVKDLLLGAVFEQTCNRLVDAFVSRARKVYG